MLAEIRSQALGADHVDVSSTQYKMALVYEEKQDYKKGDAIKHIPVNPILSMLTRILCSNLVLEFSAPNSLT
jgi:hypothetical protein